MRWIVDSHFDIKILSKIMKTVKTKEKFIELRAQGLSYVSISKKLGTAKSTLINWSKELGSKIADRKEERIEIIKAKYKLHQEAELERYGKWLKKIEQELQKRDFSEVKTDQLFKMATKITETLKQDQKFSDESDQLDIITPEELEKIARGEFEVVEC